MGKQPHDIRQKSLYQRILHDGSVRGRQFWTSSRVVSRRLVDWRVMDDMVTDFIQDYLVVNDPTLKTPFTSEQAAELYSEFASGGESGWDFSSRFESVPQFGNPGLRTYNLKNNIPICLNSILCMQPIFDMPSLHLTSLHDR